MARTHVELVEESKIPRWTTDGSEIHYGERFAGLVCGLVNDIFAEAATIALIAQYLVPEPGQPYEQPLDSIERLATDALRPHYKGEHYINSTIPRLLNKWNFWTGDPKAGMVEEYGAAGHVNVTIKVPGDFVGSPDSHTDYWSRYWVQFPNGSHSIIGPGAVIGTLIVGTDKIGPEGLNLEQWGQIQALSNRYKDIQFVAWDYEFTLGDATVIKLQGKKRFADPDYVYHL